MEPDKIQIAGSHYKDMPIQPAEFIQRNMMSWCEGNAVKYICRHSIKNGAEDIKKAIHYLQLLLQWEYGITEEEKTAPDVFYRFPEAIFVDCNTLLQQLKHVVGECNEALEEFSKKNAHVKNVAIELLDVIHSAETALRIITLSMGYNLDSLVAEVIEKNRKRGYYKENEDD